MAQYAIDDFIRLNTGEKMDYDNAYGAQCVDLFNYYNQQVIGGSWIGTPTTGGAVDLWNDFDRGAGPQFYTRIANTPEGVPQYGDVVIWDQNVPHVTGPAGHVGIFLTGDVNSLTTFDQNYPTGSPCHAQFHQNYAGVLGWLRPLVPVVPPPAPAPVPAPPAEPVVVAPTEPVQTDPAPVPVETTPQPDVPVDVVAPALPSSEPTPIFTEKPIADSPIVSNVKDTIMGKVISFLEGKKTYIVAVAIALVNGLVAGGYITIDPNTLQLVNAILAALGLGALRSAVK